jgi:hypothetical protein
MRGELSCSVVVMHYLARQAGNEAPMNHRVVGIAFIALSPVWLWLALESLGRGKTLIAILQLLAGLAFAGRGVVELRKHTG